MTDEEAEQFPQLHSAIPRDELVTIGRRVQEVKAVAPTRRTRQLPNSPVAQALVGPGIGIVDRLRDKRPGRSTS